MNLHRRMFPALLLAAALAVTSCSASQDSSSSDDLASIESSSDKDSKDKDDKTKEPTEEEAAAAEAKFEACMAEHGVEVSTFGSGDGDGVTTIDADDASTDSDAPPNPEDFAQAQKACEPILEDTFGSFDLSPEEAAEQADIQLKLEKCLADKGIDVEKNGESFTLSGDIDEADKVNDAMQECGANTAPADTDEGDS